MLVVGTYEMRWNEANVPDLLNFLLDFPSCLSRELAGMEFTVRSGVPLMKKRGAGAPGSERGHFRNK
jgi:hypothetical protein